CSAVPYGASGSVVAQRGSLDRIYTHPEPRSLVAQALPAKGRGEGGGSDPSRRGAGPTRRVASKSKQNFEKCGEMAKSQLVKPHSPMRCGRPGAAPKSRAASRCLPTYVRVAFSSESLALSGVVASRRANRRLFDPRLPRSRLGASAEQAAAGARAA